MMAVPIRDNWRSYFGDRGLKMGVITGFKNVPINMRPKHKYSHNIHVKFKHSRCILIKLC